MAGSPNVRLRLTNRAENVLLVRQALSGLGEAVGLDAVALNDISTAVTEACNNVVLHAYESAGEGPLEVELTTVAEGLDAIVRDHGIGIRPGVKAAEELSGGIGLPVIQALSETVEFRDLPTGGTEVAMHFEAAASNPPEPTAGEEGATLEAIDHGTPGDLTLMTVGPTSVARGVLPRVLSTLAARAYFSTDRISDTQMLADALVAHTDGEVLAGHLSVGVSVEPRNLEIRVGPLRAGRADALFDDAAIDGLGPMLERLTDGHTVSPAGTAEMLDVRLAQRG
jgi:serine/threonine-protein kinase RsbW